MTKRIGLLALSLFLLSNNAPILFGSDSPAIVKSEFIYETAPFPECHASTIVETQDGRLIAAWFGGSREGKKDVGIWVAETDSSGKWSTPVEVANGIQHEDLRYPCWNPVLVRNLDKTGKISLYYKCGPNPREWWGMLMTHDGDGWSTPCRLPEGIDGPVKNKPIRLKDGGLLCPSSTEYDGWRVHFELTKDDGKTWKRIGPINDGKTFNIIQPSILIHKDGRLQILCRSREGSVVTSWSSDQGLTWSEPVATVLPNPNSGTDALTLQDGRHAIVYNNTPKGRSPLNVATSDDGKNWKDQVVLEDQKGEYSYPAIIQSSDGLIHITYTWKRQKIRHVVLNPMKLSKNAD